MLYNSIFKQLSQFSATWFVFPHVNKQTNKQTINKKKSKIIRWTFFSKSVLKSWTVFARLQLIAHLLSFEPPANILSNPTELQSTFLFYLGLYCSLFGLYTNRSTGILLNFKLSLRHLILLMETSFPPFSLPAWIFFSGVLKVTRKRINQVIVIV